MLPTNVNILETTLRDGNYLVNFQFTAADTAWLCERFEECGMEYVEIGHGLGMGASDVYKTAAATDAEYIEAARGALKNAKFGMFAIPGVATLDHLTMAADLGMDFIRIGANVDRVDSMEEYILKARDVGLFVFTNFMKSYCMPPEEFSKVGARAQEFGSQMNYIVDSAGGMLPEDIRNYFQALCAETKIPTGFHGHDNTRMAVANSLVAAESGAILLDTTLFGIGRGSGNAATELMAALLKQRFGLLPHIDERRLIQLAECQAAPLLHHRHSESISMSLGLAQVHSMHLNDIVEYAEKEGIDHHDLIAHVGRIDRLNVDDDILSKAAENAKSEGPLSPMAAGGIFAIQASDTPEEVVLNAENLAEKIGVSCRICVIEAEGLSTADIVQHPTSVDVILKGDPREAVCAAKPNITTVYVAPNLDYLIEELRELTDCMVRSAAAPLIFDVKEKADRKTFDKN